MQKKDVAIQYRKKYGADMPSLKLARIMREKEPLLFDSVEAARNTLRYIEGKAGYGARSKSIVKHQDRPKNPFKLPASEETDFAPVKVKTKRALILADIHAPYHSIDALSAAIKFAKDEQPDTVIIDGDLFDFHGISRYMKDPRKKNFAHELDTGTAIMRTLQDELKAEIYFKLGNHDERYQHYLWMKAGEIADVEDFQLSNLISQRVYGVKIIDDKKIVQLGGLNVVHGHEFPSGISSPVNIARGFYLRGKTSVIGGHHHRTSEHTEQDMNGKITTTWSVGCLSELHPAYMPINSWNHGFAIVDVDKEEFTVRNYRIYKGRVL